MYNEPKVYGIRMEYRCNFCIVLYIILIKCSKCLIWTLNDMQVLVVEIITFGYKKFKRVNVNYVLIKKF